MSFKRPPARPAKQYEGTRPASPRQAAACTLTAAALREIENLPAPAPRAQAAPTIKERAYMGRVAAMGCLICRRLDHGLHAAEVHHVRVGQGGAERASNYLTVPLCPEHHRGRTGIHGMGSRAFERRYGIDELGLVAEVVRELCFVPPSIPENSKGATP